MRLKNSTDFPDYMLRRMVSWCCKQIGIPVGRVREAQFRQRQEHRFSGVAYPTLGRFVCSVAPESFFPWTDGGRSTGIRGIVRTYNDRIECLVGLTSHELRHLRAGIENERTRRGGRGSSERLTELEAQQVLELFRANRERLLAEWYAVYPNPKKKKQSRQQANAIKASNKLREWRRKLKLAQTKVRQYNQKVRRYERLGIIAATSSPSTKGDRNV